MNEEDFYFLLNRLSDAAAADGWVHVCPMGEHPYHNKDGSVIIQVIDRDACQAMATRYPLNDKDAMWDWEHDSMTANGSSKASGWGQEAQVRDDGLWVRVEWTPDGLKDVKGKTYRYNSPCFPRATAVHLGGNRYRMTELARVALTNNPNLSGQKPLANSRLDPAANPQQDTTKMDFKAILLKLLGLPATATDQEIQAACDKTGDKTTTTLNARIGELETQLANTDLDAHGITDAGQRSLFTPLLTNAATRLSALASLGIMKGKAATPNVLHNRQGAPVPSTDKHLSQGEKDQEKSDREFNAAVADYQNTKGCSYEAADRYVSNQWKMEGKL